MESLTALDILEIFLETIRDVLPIVAVLFLFQVFVLRLPVPNLRRVLIGLCYVIVGLALFLIGLEEALFPLGKIMVVRR